MQKKVLFNFISSAVIGNFLIIYYVAAYFYRNFPFLVLLFDLDCAGNFYNFVTFESSLLCVCGL